MTIGEELCVETIISAREYDWGRRQTTVRASLTDVREDYLRLESVRGLLIGALEHLLKRKRRSKRTLR